MVECVRYPGMLHLNGNLLAAVDLETTGTRPGYHEIIQIAIVPLDGEIRPLTDVAPFYSLIKPEHPEREEPSARLKHKILMTDLMLHAPETDQVADWLVEWFEALRLPFKRCLAPLAHNWAFESAFLKAWLGVSMMDQIFHAHARDSMLYAVALNDRAICAGLPAPFPGSVSLTSCCRRLGVINANPHDALSDCLADAEVYRSLLQLD